MTGGDEAGCQRPTAPKRLDPGPKTNQLQDIHLGGKVRHCQGLGSRPALVSESENQAMPQRLSRTNPGSAAINAGASHSKKASYLAFIHPTKVLSSRRHCGCLPGHCLGNQGSFCIPTASLCKPKASPQSCSPCAQAPLS